MRLYSTYGLRGDDAKQELPNRVQFDYLTVRITSQGRIFYYIEHIAQSFQAAYSRTVV
jgi:hypothetical protein